MGLVIFICTLEVLVFILYLPHAPLYWPIPVVFMYAMFWFMLDDSEETGTKTWKYLRNLRFWQTKFTAVQYFFGDKASIVEQPIDSRLLFVIVKGNVTNMGLISGFGLHGGVFEELNLCYILPWVLFKVPILREILMWTGAISSGQGDVNSVILNALNRGKSVCYPINGMTEITIDKLTKDGINEEQVIAEDLFEFAKVKRIKLVPVLIENEHKRYSIWQFPALHEFSLKLSGFPFPFIFGPKIFGQDPPTKVDIKIGVPTDPTKYENVKDFSRHFFLQINGIV